MWALQFDHCQTCTSLLSWIIGLLLVIVVPLLRLCFLRAASGNSNYELVFQPLVVVVEIALSMVSFLFLSRAIRRHGLRGVLFLDAAEEEATEVQHEYEAVIEKGRMLLAKLFFPSLVCYIAFKAWFYAETTTYLYTCILFATVCAVQELKMLKYRDLLEDGLDPEFYFHIHVKIMKCLQATSRRFRSFLAFIMSITLVAFLASMYKVVAAERAGINMMMSAEIVILNLVSLSGTGLCLRAASKLSHLHRQIIKTAALMHAIGTFETSFVCLGSMQTTETECLHRFCKIQDAWIRRAALVNFISNSSVGISVYGFVLDRFFIHASVGGLLTTTWFILGQSLSS